MIGRYTVNTSLDTDEPIMLINEQIGADEDGEGIDGVEFQRELFELDGLGKKAIKIIINSPGGMVMDGYNIYCAMQKTKTPVDTYVGGIAASIACVIFMGGRNRVMADYSTIMMHNPFGGDRKQLQAMQDGIVKMISAKCNLDENEVQQLMDRTTWMNASDALAKGFATEIEATDQKNKKRKSTDAKALWEESKLILNNIFNNKNEEIMANEPTPVNKAAIGLSLIAQYLGLNTDATENSILTEVKSKINAAVLDKEEKDEELDQIKKDLAKMKKDLEAKQAEYDEKCKELNALKEKAEKDKKEADDKAKAEKEAAEAKAKKAEDDAKEEKAKNMIADFVKIGKVANKQEAIDKWVAKAKDDIEGVKAMLDEIPMNKTAVHISDNGGEGKVETTAAILMAKVKNSISSKKAS